jgi:hypothetical protein
VIGADTKAVMQADTASPTGIAPPSSTVERAAAYLATQQLELATTGAIAQAIGATMTSVHTALNREASRDNPRIYQPRRGVWAITAARPLQSPPAGVEIIAAVLGEHHATTIAAGAGVYRWACLCQARQDPATDATGHAAAWRAARNHEAQQVVAALREAP